MEPRFSMFDNEIGARFSKRFASASMVLAQSPLPMSLQELVALRASQINGCGWCVDLHTKEAAAAGETAVRLALVATWRESTVFTDAGGAGIAGTVSYISAKAEFTPRNVQTTEERVKLVYAVKVRITADAGNELKPGMPADVTLRGEATTP